MSELTTIARPYARALLQHAKEQQTLNSWRAVLGVLSALMQEEVVTRWVVSPNAQMAEKSAFFLECIKTILPKEEKEIGQSVENFLRLIIEKKRLSALPEIAEIYKNLLAAELRVEQVRVETAFPLTDEQKKSLEKILNQWLNARVNLDVQHNEALLGGLVIRTNQFVMDGSIKGGLERLFLNLMA